MKVSRLFSLVIGILLSAISVAAQAQDTAVKPATFYFQNREIIKIGRASCRERV